MKKHIAAILTAGILSCLCVTTSLAAVVVGPGSGSGSSSSMGIVSGYDIYAGSEAYITQPPKRNDLVDYELPFTCVYVSGLSFIMYEPSADSLRISMSDPGEYFRYLGEEGDYYKIMFDGNEVYISKSGASLTNTIKMDPGLAVRAEVVKAAFTNLGCKYSYGGSSAATGFDCSGFIYSTFSSCGIPIGRSTSEQVLQGTPIDVSQIRPGDLLFYADAAGNVEHGAIYVGNGMLIHSHSTGQGVRMQSYNYRMQSSNYATAAPVSINNVNGDQN